MAGTQDITEFVTKSYGRKKKNPCQVKIAKALLSEQQAAQVDAACAERELVSNGAIRDWLMEHGGHDVSINAITSHRKGTCSCVKP